MAIKDFIAFGIGVVPGHVKYFVLTGLSSGMLPAPDERAMAIAEEVRVMPVSSEARVISVSQEVRVYPVR